MTESESNIIVFKPSEKIVKVSAGETILNAAEKAGIRLSAICGGKGKCGKCKVRILNADIPANSIEQSALTAKEIENNIHLACQVVVDKGLEIELTEDVTDDQVQFLAHTTESNPDIDNHVSKIYVEMKPSDIEHPIDDINNIKNHIFLDKEGVTLQIPLSILQNLPTFLRKNDYKITFILSGDKLIHIEAGDSTHRSYGFAIDLGTTTIAGALVDLNSGKEIAQCSKTNPQSIHGADVITRVNYSAHEPGGLGRLQKLVLETINEMIEELSAAVDVSFREIYEITIAGNTIMNHLFLGINPQFIGVAPYVPAFKDPQSFPAEELGLSLLPNASVVILPNISGYVGGDISAFILACRFHEKEKIALGIDIGTNGEIILGSKEGLVCSAAAAGPAFEGGHISCGMRATTGAIDKIVFDEQGIFYDVIGDVEPKGLCGTGLIDLLAELLRYEIIDEGGKFCKIEACVGKWYQDRIIDGENGRGFVVVPVFQSAGEEAITVTQKDIRELQLAKAAVAAGINILEKELNISDSDISEVLLAGAFGNYINKNNAQYIGLIPKTISLDKIHFVGNAASSGAKRYLLSEKARIETKEIILFTQYIELSNRSEFQSEFSEAIFFNG